MANNKSLNGKVIIVTGAGRGIGREIALLAAAEGAKVVVNDPGERSGNVVRGVLPKRALARIVFASGASLGRWCDRGWPYVDRTGCWRGLLPRSSLRSANPATLGARQPLSAVLDVPGRRAAGFQQARTRSSFALFPPVLSSFILLETGAI